ncbi:MAG: hypothetical protein ACLFS6_03720 [Methanomassiliicoccales archaeon]
MIVIRKEEMKWEEGRGYDKRVLLEDESENPLLQQVLFREGESVPPHYHMDQTEVFVFLGPGSIVIEGERLDMESMEVVVCEPPEVHQVPEVEKEFSLLVLKRNYRPGDTFWLEEEKRPGGREEDPLQ